MKKLFTLILVLVIVCGTVSTVSAATVYGDVNLDNDVTIVDVTEIQYYVASLKELSNSALENADVDADGEISIIDATCISLYIADLIDKFPSQGQEQDLSLYRPYIEKALDEHYDGYGYYVAGGYLCDVDNNGVEELVMVYTTIPEGYDYYGDVYSIYTMVDNEVVPLAEKELFFMHAGGPSGEVYLMDNGNDKMLGFMYSQARHIENETYGTIGDWDFYYVDGKDLSNHRNVQYFYVEEESGNIDYYNSYIIENGVKSSYKEFEEWLSTFDDKECILVSSYDGKNLSTLEDLYNELA